ncbi:hypothetical protein [Streptomyces sp. Go-475]|uniref:hypothetical protein n=1 Tax=Streptomyces sp. Go-475 TaxID=2072505 RepID=UPI000DEF35C3|nr:hypothetical protein [Streptomyces sp. Go-475]
MSIIPEGQSELRRMPADGTGKTGFYQPGGVMQRLAEGREENILRSTRRDVERAMALVMNPKATKDQLIRSLYTMCFWANQAAEVAECRGERLTAMSDDETEELTAD